MLGSLDIQPKVMAGSLVWLPLGTTQHAIVGLNPQIRYHFQLHILNIAGNRNQVFNMTTVEPAVNV